MVKHKLNGLENEDEWDYKNVRGADEYGSAVHHVLEQQDGTYIRIALSEGGHIMECPRGSWQVTVGRDETDCFDTEGKAFEYAIRRANQISHEE